LDGTVKVSYIPGRKRGEAEIFESAIFDGVIRTDENQEPHEIRRLHPTEILYRDVLLLTDLNGHEITKKPIVVDMAAAHLKNDNGQLDYTKNA
jgi:hypothetical protein